MDEMDRDIDSLYTVVDAEFRKSKFNENDSGAEFEELVDRVAIKVSMGSGMDLFNSVSDTLIAAIDLIESSLDEKMINGLHHRVFKLALDYCEDD